MHDVFVVICMLLIPCKNRALFPTVVILKCTIKPTGKEDNLTFDYS